MTTTHFEATSLNTLPLRERLTWLRMWDAATPCGAFLVLSVLELHQPTEGFYSLTPREVEAYFSSGYELTLLASESCALGVEHRFLLVKHNSLNPFVIAEALRTR